MIMRRLIFLISIGLFISSRAFAQYDLINYFESDVQSAHLKPAYIPDSTLTIVLPGIGYSIAQKGPKLGNIIVSNNEGNNIVDIDALTANLESNNSIRGTYDRPMGNLYFKKWGMVASAGYGWRSDGQLNYNQALGELYAYGNGNFIGQEIEVAPSFSLQSYHEFSLGLAKSFNRFSFGVKGRFLSGVENISADQGNVKVFTSDDIYQLRLNTDLVVNSSRVIDYTSIDDIDISTRGFSYSNFFAANYGFVFDAGLNIKMTERLNLSLSVLDVGSINWDFRTSNLTSSGESTYEGVDLISYIGDTTSIALEDSLKKILDIVETNDSYSTSLPLKIYLGADFQMNASTRVGATFFYESLLEESSIAFAINGTKQFSGSFRLGAQYAYTKESPLNLGLSTALNWRGICIMASSDNVIGLFTPTKYGLSNMRLALAFKI